MTGNDLLAETDSAKFNMGELQELRDEVIARYFY